MDSSGESQRAEFEQAAARVVVPPEVIPDAADAGLPSTEGAARPSEPAAPEVSPSLHVKREWAAAAVKFAPPCSLLAMRDPRWLLPDEDCEKAAPAMQAFLQSAADKWLPLWFAKAAGRWPELTDLVAVLAVLTWNRMQFIAADNARRARENPPAAAAGKVRTIDGSAPPEGGGVVVDASNPAPYTGDTKPEDGGAS